MDRHHLLEIILWPQTDGSFKTIINSRQRLKDLGIYDEFKLTIKIEHAQHAALHAKHNVKFRNFIGSRIGAKLSDETKAKMSAAKRGKARSLETKAKISEKMRGRKRPPFSAEWRAKMSASHKKKKDK